MSLNAATIEFLLARGLTGDDILSVAQRLEQSEKPRSAAAKRQARYRQNKAESVTNNVTGDVTAPPIEEIIPPSSEPNGSGSPAADPVKELFDVGVAILTSTGTAEKQARTLLGKWRKDKGEVEVLKALLDCRARSISQPIEWIEARFKTAKYVSATGHQYRGDDQAILREAEKRADWTTYWAVKAAMQRAA